MSLLLPPPPSSCHRQDELHDIHLLFTVLHIYYVHSLTRSSQPHSILCTLRCVFSLIWSLFSDHRFIVTLERELCDIRHGRMTQAHRINGNKNDEKYLFFSRIECVTWQQQQQKSKTTNGRNPTIAMCTNAMKRRGRKKNVETNFGFNAFEWASQNNWFYHYHYGRPWLREVLPWIVCSLIVDTK